MDFCGPAAFCINAVEGFQTNKVGNCGRQLGYGVYIYKDMTMDQFAFFSYIELVWLTYMCTRAVKISVISKKSCQIYIGGVFRPVCCCGELHSSNFRSTTTSLHDIILITAFLCQLHHFSNTNIPNMISSSFLPFLQNQQILQQARQVCQPRLKLYILL